MKKGLTFIGVLLLFMNFGQVKTDTIKVIAKLISEGEGSKVYVAKYQVINSIKGEVSNDTIQAGYYFYNEFKNISDTVLLYLNPYTGDTKINDYYVFPEYNAKKGIESIQVSTILFEHWENCETKPYKCKKLTLTRKEGIQNWFLFMPCGGTQTDVSLTNEEQKVIQTNSVTIAECPPWFDLTKVPEGKYFVNMLACGLGGEIEIVIKK